MVLGVTITSGHSIHFRPVRLMKINMVLVPRIVEETFLFFPQHPVISFGMQISLSPRCLRLNRIRDSKLGTTSSATIIKDVDLALKALEKVYRANGAIVEGLSDRNRYKCKEVGEGKSVSWGGARCGRQKM